MTEVCENEESGLVGHARQELTLIGQFDEDPEFAESIVKAVEAFLSYGHSGGSASVGIAMLHELLQGHNLAALTASPDEWLEVGTGVWQNRRRGDAFSEDGGKTYYLLDEEPRVIHEAETSS